MLFLFLVFKPVLHDHQARHQEGGQIQSNKGVFHGRDNEAREPYSHEHYENVDEVFGHLLCFAFTT